MAFIISWRLIISFLVCVSMINGANASSTYNVGDELQWDIPLLGDVSYKNWTALHRFFVGDTLVFNFFDGFHNVAEVSKTAYDACNTQFPISISNSVPTYVTLNSAGEHYYICTIHGHCGAGMKLAINVSAPPAAASAPQPRVAPSAPTPTPASFSSTTSSHSSSIANPPSGRSTASSPTPSAPPSSSSAPIVAVAAVPFTMLSIAFIFFFSFSR